MPYLRRRPSVGTILGTLALFVSLGGVGYSATGGTFILGNANTATTPSSLSAPVAGKTLQLTNTSTGVGATALGLSVASGKTPFTVNSSTKVTNLNADRLDGLDSTSFLRSTGKAADSNKLDGLDSTAFAEAGPLDWHAVDPQPGNFSSADGTFKCNALNQNGTACVSYWQNLGGSWARAAYAKDAFGIVHLRGLITCVVGANRPASDCPGIDRPFALPLEYRPGESEVFAVNSNDAFAGIYIYWYGPLEVRSGSVTAWTSLDGITFPAT